MNSDTLKAVLRYGDELISKAQDIQDNTFERLSPDCEFRIMNFNEGEPCCRKTAVGSQALECALRNCPLIRPELEDIDEKDGLGLA